MAKRYSMFIDTTGTSPKSLAIEDKFGEWVKYSEYRSDEMRLRERLIDMLVLVREDDNEWETRRDEFEQRIASAKLIVEDTE